MIYDQPTLLHIRSSVDTLSWQLQEDVLQTVLTDVPEDLRRLTWVPLHRKHRRRGGKQAGISVRFKNYVVVFLTADPRCFLDGLSSDHAWFVFWRSLEPLQQLIKPVLPDLCDQLPRLACLVSVEAVCPREFLPAGSCIPASLRFEVD